VPCLFVVPRLFTTADEVAKLIRGICYLFVPSAVYLIYQSYFGLTWWEHKYLKSGLSIEVRQYQERVFRCMGTMAGAAGATIVYSIITAIVAHGGMWRWRNETTRAANSSPALRFFLAAFYAFAAIRTFSRTGWVLGMAAWIAMLALPRKPFVVMIYTAGLTLYFAIVLSAPYLLKNKVLNDIDNQQRATDSAEERQTKQLSTLNGRLEGYYELMHTKGILTPFGAKLAGKKTSIKAHDFVTDVLFTYGYIPFIFGIFLASRLLGWIHGHIFRMDPSLNRDIAVTGVACVLGIALGAITNGAQFSVFPQNLLVYMFFGIALAMILVEIGRDKDQEAEYADRLRALRETELASMRGRRGQQPQTRRRPLYAGVR
jgi:hypothetical protein